MASGSRGLDTITTSSNNEASTTGGLEQMNPLQQLEAFVRGPSAEQRQIAQLQNRAAEAEQQVLALQQRLDMANKLNTEAREQLAKLAILPAGFYGDKWLSQDDFAAIWEALQ